MKVLFIHPPWPGPGYGLRSQNRWPRKRGDKSNRYPVLLAYAVTLIKRDGHDVKYIDSVFQGFDYERTLKEIEKYNPDIIYVETATSAYKHDVHFAKLVKEKFPQITFIIAGTHVTYQPEKSLQEAPFDIVIKGELDLPSLNTVNALRDGKDLSTVKGIAYRDKEGKIHNNEDQPLIQDLNGLPFPDREIIPHQWYSEGHVVNFPFTFIMGGRGCPFLCTFCLWPSINYNRKFRSRSPDNICDEIEWLIDKYGMKEVYFDEGTFNVGTKRAIDISKKIVERGIKIKWSCNGRVDAVNKEMLDWMEKAGCKLICYGPESANEETLKRVKKALKPEQTVRCFELMKQTNITAHANYMIGWPWESAEDIKRTMQQAIDIKPDTVQFSLVFPIPGTDMYEESKENNWFYEDVLLDTNRFEMATGPVIKSKTSREELMNAIAKSHAQFFLRPSFIINELAKIRSFKDVKRIARGADSIIRGKILYNMGKQRSVVNA